MSCYVWESGDIVIPAASWAAFKKNLRDRYNRALAEDFAAAERIVAEVKRANKGKRGVVWRNAVEDHLRNQRSSAFKVQSTEDVCSLLTPSGTKALLRPKKKDFPAATNKTTSFRAGDEARFRFDDKTHTVHWGVPENNHACDDAHDSFMGRALFSELGAIQWGRNSGGVIVGNNEYNTDNKEEGGGGNTVNFRFGPFGDTRRDRW